MQNVSGGDVLLDKQEYTILQDWETIQRELLNFALVAPSTQAFSWRAIIDTHIMRTTNGQACIYWDPLALGDALGCDRFCEVRYRDIRYGFLGLAPGYLSSRAFPDLPQNFAHLCALLIAFTEYQAFVQYQMEYLPTPFPGDYIGKLTRRESDVLLGLMRGESDPAMAERLGIEPTTVHTHRKRLYRRLGVHSTQEATLRCFTHRLIDWLAGPHAHPIQEEEEHFPAKEVKSQPWAHVHSEHRPKLLTRDELHLVRSHHSTLRKTK